MPYRVLDHDQVEEFISRGFICLRGAIPQDFIEEATDNFWIRLGYDPHDPTTWSEDYFGMPRHRAWMPEDVVPKVWGASCDLLGGEDRTLQRPWSDSFVVNFGNGSDVPYEAPTPQTGGWHIDGDSYRRYLDSPELALLTVALFSDVQPKGGPTVLLPESVALISRYLNKHRDGPHIVDMGLKAIAEQCTEVVELTGDAGDVFLIHAYMLHAPSPNVLQVARIMHNPGIQLREPMCFDREDPSKYSPVERSILKGIGVDRLAYAPEGPRERKRDHGAKRRAYIRAERKRIEEIRLHAAAVTAANALHGFT